MAIFDDIARLSAQIARTTDDTARARMTTELVALNEKIPRGTGRKAEFNVDAETHSGTRGLSLRRLLDVPARTDQEREAATFMDHAVTLGALLRKDPRDTKF